ncbi:NUDIX domain-containing protein [Nannocystis sp. RBIL2]|uniref:NUDIX domain-containing protein n=1 Tax=Nannocystis sp. RBIL2 TaxID=2996788 RepID=UPI0022716231|nr:NUDIX domain-containing protein [Nannocystis sp. RBIL2]MCY1070625.1 NUDIX domain-containing protein [Nannocystis sp. RBIL2]
MPRLAVRAILIEDDKILLEQFQDANESWYVTPGGGVDENETIEEAFHRELREELGVQAEFGAVAFIREIIADRLTVTNLPRGFHQVEVFVYGRLLPGQTLQMLAPDPSQIGLVWVPLAELHTLPFFPRDLIAEFQARAFPRFYYGHRR